MNNHKMYVSIIIATNNSEKTIYDCLNSIKKQTYFNYEVIIIDNASLDSTIEIVNSFKFEKIKIIKEKDNGIYEGLNKGIKNSSGDVVSILHSDDLYYDNDALKKIVETFEKTKVDIIYSNLIYVKKNDVHSIVRLWKPGKFVVNSFLKGWNPPHPTFVVKRAIYNENDLYNQSIGNSADIELMHRFLEIKKYNFFYLNEILVKMRYGGASNKKIISIIKQNIMILKFLGINNNLKRIIIFFISKFFDRLKQFILR